jgi:hypothetical protein
MTMASFVWNRDPEEAYSNPYEYGAQEQFVREAKKILSRLCKVLGKHNLHFNRDACSLQKATWMLHNDTINALREALSLLEKKKHELVGRIFRDVWESCQLVEYFLSSSPQSQGDLKKWFDNEVISHKSIRERLEKSGRKAEAEEKRQRQRELSKFTHRTYRALLKGYSLGGDDKMVYDGCTKYSVAPHTLSAYYAILGDLIFQTLGSMKKSKFISKEEAKKILRQSLEKTTVPRKFAPI